MGASRRNGEPNYNAGIKNGMEIPRRFFCVDDWNEKGFFYSVNVLITHHVHLLLTRNAPTVQPC